MKQNTQHSSSRTSLQAKADSARVTIFDFTDYKVFLVAWIESRTGNGRGLKLAIAEASQCQSAYVSRVLNGAAHFSLEQAECIAHFLRLSDEETHFFLLLVQSTRAGTERLREHFRRQMKLITDRQFVIKDRLKISNHLSLENQAHYYSAWYYCAVHILLSVPQFQTLEALCAYLGFTSHKVEQILKFLVECGLAFHRKGTFQIGTVRVHIGSDSPFISKHHANWRMLALRSMDTTTHTHAESDLHYSGVISLSTKDATQLKQLLIQTIEDFNKVVEKSEEQEVLCCGIDFFNLKNLNQ